MKKLLLVSMCSLGIAFNALAFDQARFDEDMGYYNLDKGKSHTIVVLLSPFNTDNALKDASNLYNNGNPSKWMALEDKLNAAINKGESIMPDTYMSDCASATKYASSMWKYATYMTSNNFGEWDNPEAANLKMYKKAKTKFQDIFQKCKSAVNNPPNKKDY